MRSSLAMIVLLVAACGGTDATEPAETTAGIGAAPTTTAAGEPATEDASDGCAHVLDAEIQPAGGDFTISATVRSADTGWDKYADAWEVRSPDGEVLGERVLAHPHENEQPFTRSLSSVSIPEDIASVTLAARDSVEGFCGATVTITVPHP